MRGRWGSPAGVAELRGQENRMLKKTIKIPIVLVALIAVIGVVGGLLYLNQQKQAAREKAVTAAEVVPWDAEFPEETLPEITGKILLPGYSRMVMAANTTAQSANIGNPKENNCYFVIVLKLADGTVLFESDDLKPGEGYDHINLKTPLQAGEYQAVIEYHCYTLEDRSALNGGSCGFQLVVE